MDLNKKKKLRKSAVALKKTKDNKEGKEYGGRNQFASTEEKKSFKKYKQDPDKKTYKSKTA